MSTQFLDEFASIFTKGPLTFIFKEINFQKYEDKFISERLKDNPNLINDLIDDSLIENTYLKPINEILSTSQIAIQEINALQRKPNNTTLSILSYLKIEIFFCKVIKTKL